MLDLPCSAGLSCTHIPMACGISVLRSGIEPESSTLEGEFFTAGPLRKSPHRFWLFWLLYAAAAKSLQSYLTLCNPRDGSPLDSSVTGTLQARILGWAAISFSKAWKWKVKVKSLSRAQLLATAWIAAYQTPPSVGFFQARVLEWGAIAFSRLLYSESYWRN